MKSRFSLIFAALAVLLGSMLWVVQDRRSPATAPMAAAVPVARVPQVAFAAPDVAAPVDPPTVLPQTAIVEPRVAKSAPMVHVEPSGEVDYVARDGDTLSQLAAALLGSDTKEHRDAVVASNVTLQPNPDHVLTGHTYSVGSTPDASADNEPSAALRAEGVSSAGRSEAAQPASEAVTPADDAPAAAGPRLKYVAKPGDSVAVLAGNLLGGDTKVNRDAIIAANESLREYPNHLIAGQSYTIVAPDGLASDPAAPQAKASTVRPDADEAIQLSVGRSLRYTAVAGDTVSKLAVALLGSDTPANQALIIDSNPSLRKDPDHLVAGQTYWISAPVPVSQ